MARLESRALTIEAWANDGEDKHSYFRNDVPSSEINNHIKSFMERMKGNGAVPERIRMTWL